MDIIQNYISHMSSYTLFFAALGGVIPAVLWLIFWLQEDEHPEPRELIFISFLSGMACVLFVLPIQFFISKYVIDNKDISNVLLTDFTLGAAVVAIWASTEEFLKYVASHIGKRRLEAIDEPIDWIIYLISTALGFAAAENTLFLITPLAEGNIGASIATGNLRFIGATLLHVVSSSAIGMFLAFSFYKSEKVKQIYRILGIISAIFLHTVFNLFIIVNNGSTLAVFSTVWFAAILIIITLERIKRLRKQ